MSDVKTPDEFDRAKFTPRLITISGKEYLIDQFTFWQYLDLGGSLDRVMSIVSSFLTENWGDDYPPEDRLKSLQSRLNQRLQPYKNDIAVIFCVALGREPSAANIDWVNSVVTDPDEGEKLFSAIIEAHSFFFVRRLQEMAKTSLAKLGDALSAKSPGNSSGPIISSM